MNPFRKGFVVVAIAVAASDLGPSAAEETIHACEDAKGNVVYQGDPCLGTAREAGVAARRKGVPMPEAPTGRPLPGVAPQRSADAHGATPDGVVRRFVAAVNAGDRKLAISCLTISALARLAPDADSLPMNVLRRTVSRFTGYVNEGDQGPYWSIRALRAGTRPKWILLAKSVSGDWKIAAF